MESLFHLPAAPHLWGETMGEGWLVIHACLASPAVPRAGGPSPAERPGPSPAGPPGPRRSRSGSAAAPVLRREVLPDAERARLCSAFRQVMDSGSVVIV